MVKSKSNALGKLPKDQKCEFLIGPINSWFMPSATDIWTRPSKAPYKEDDNFKVSQDDNMDCDQSSSEDSASLSYLIYGSIGCFCYGRIYHQLSHSATHDKEVRLQKDHFGGISANVDHLIDLKEDNSRVSCVRFLRGASYPLAMILTESGSLFVHDCELVENLIHLKKSELIAKLVEPIVPRQEEARPEHCSKKPRFNVTQQINSCVWPDVENAFLGVSLLKEKTSFVFWLKLKNLTSMRRKGSPMITKNEFIDSYDKLNLDLTQYTSPICCMESTKLDHDNCLIAIAMDDGLITVIKVNFNEGQASRVIKLVRHHDQVCSLSFFTENTKKFPLGLLASASRNGLVLLWDVENEFYYADYQAPSDGGRVKINWYALSFVFSRDSSVANLVVSNSESGLTVLELPENTRSKIRLKESKDKLQHHKKQVVEQTLRHHALIFNIAFDPLTGTLMTSSLDGNQIIWKCHANDLTAKNGKKEGSLIDVRPHYLFPSMTNNSRTHMLRHSPIREDLLGIALGKAGVKFFKVAEDHAKHRFDMSSSCSLIARKITKASLTPTSLSWHPSHEYRVAIGTLEGKVLRADLTPRRATLVEAEHRPINQFRSLENNELITSDDIFDVEYQPIERTDSELDEVRNDSVRSREQSKTDAIYSLCWGPNPCCPQDVTRLAIYAIGSITHRLFIYYTKKENGDKLTNYLDEFLDQSLPEAIGESSEVAWKSSLDFMALGTTTGKVLIVSYISEIHESERNSSKELFTKLAVIQGPLGHTFIQCLAWHPTTDEEDPHYYYIAVSANESPVYIFNIKENILVADVKARLKIEEELKESYADSTSHIVSSYVHKLDSHIKAVSDIAWNPHNPNQIATCSFDRNCFVWSIGESENSSSLDSAQVVAKFSARDRLFTLEWSLVDSDLIFTSGHDSTVWAWRPSENLKRKVTSD